MTAPLAATPFSITDPLPTGTVLLEASAGTGKTWTIAALVTRWVAEGLVTLPEMLIVTFGRAASQELRARVRERLTEVEHDLGEPPPMHERDELVALLLDTTDHEIAVRRRRIRTALTQFDAATIATTHQFCQQVLRSLGVAGTTDASAVLVEDLDDVLADVVDDLYLRAFGQASDAPFFGRSEALTIARTAVDDIHAQLRPSGADPTSDVGRRVRFAQAVRDEVDVRKRRLQVMHYNDLLTQLAGALEAPDSPARQRMRDRWRVVLVDEFQDTDPIQWQVLDRAFTGHALAMVLRDGPDARDEPSLRRARRQGAGCLSRRGRTRRPSDRCPSRRRSPSRLTVGRYAVRRPGSPAPGPARGPPGWQGLRWRRPALHRR